MNNMLKKTKQVLYSLINKLPFKKVSIFDHFRMYYIQYKVLFVLAGVVLAIFVYQLIIPLIQSISFVKPHVLSKQGNDYWAKQDQFYYDPIQIVTYSSTATLVDIRRNEEYKAEHIMGAINIPVETKAEDQNEISNKKEVLEAFKKLDSKKEIVIYGDNSYSSKPIKTAALLTQKGIPVQVMSVGWNEFRHLTNFWLPEHLWNKVLIIDFLEGTLIEQ